MADKAKMVLVDDDFVSLRILKTTLDHGHYDIFTAKDGVTALQLLHDNSADILITDIRMPGMDGLELIQEAKKCMPDLICIVVSASDDIKLCIEAMKLGAVNYILKPINYHELNHTVNNALEKFHLIQNVRKKQLELEEKNKQLIQEIERRKQLYDNLQDNEQHLKELFENINSGVAIYKPVNRGEDFVFTDLNRAAEKIGMIKKDDVKGKTITEVYPRIKELELFDVLKKVNETDDPIYLPVKQYFDDERELWLSNYVFKIPAGQLVAVYEDFTNQQKAEFHLQESQEQLQLAVDGSELGIWNLDLNDMTFKLNEKWDDLFGMKFRKGLVEYDTIRNLLHPEDKMFSYDDFAHISNDENNFYEKRLRVKTNHEHWKWILVRGKVVEWDECEKPVRAAGTIQNYTFVKNIEDALLETQYRLNTILNNMHEIIFYMDVDRKILWVNRTACEVARKSESDVIGSHCYNTLFDNKDICDKCPVSLRPNDEKWENFITKNGRTYHMHIYPIKDAKDQVAAYIEVGLDVTEQEKAKEEARLRAEQLFQADKMVSLGILVSGVAHEINNPNNYMMLNIALIKQAWDDLVPALDACSCNNELVGADMEWSELKNEMPTLMTGIEEGTERIKEIVRELKDYARDIPVDMTSEVKIDDVIHAALILCESLIKRSTKNFVYNCEKYIPVFKGDPQRIEQVVINIIQNACQSLSVRDKSITINAYHDLEQNDVVIEVIDEGKGISAKHLKRIKDPFFTTKREDGGTGLGVSISNTIITEHKGELNFESEEGKGTKVLVRLPVRS